MERKKSQGMFEYILLLAGILLIVVLAVVVLRGGIFQGAGQSTKVTACQAALARNSSCYTSGGLWTNASLAPVIGGTLPGSCQDSDVLTNFMKPQSDCIAGTPGCPFLLGQPYYYHCGVKPA